MRQRFEQVNNYVRQINQLSTLAFGYLEKLRAWNKSTRSDMLEGFISIHAMEKKKAQQMVKKYLVPVRKLDFFFPKNEKEEKIK